MPEGPVPLPCSQPDALLPKATRAAHPVPSVATLSGAVKCEVCAMALPSSSSAVHRQCTSQHPAGHLPLHLTSEPRPPCPCTASLPVSVLAPLPAPWHTALPHAQASLLPSQAKAGAVSSAACKQRYCCQYLCGHHVCLMQVSSWPHVDLTLASCGPHAGLVWVLSPQ